APTVTWLGSAALPVPPVPPTPSWLPPSEDPVTRSQPASASTAARAAARMVAGRPRRRAGMMSMPTLWGPRVSTSDRAEATVACRVGKALLAGRLGATGRPAARRRGPAGLRGRRRSPGPRRSGPRAGRLGFDGHLVGALVRAQPAPGRLAQQSLV